MDATARTIQGGDGVTDIIIAFLLGVFIGTNFGFLIAGLMWGISDDEMLD